MTREDAIRIIKIVLAVAEDFEITVQGEEFTEEKCKEAVEMATKALEQTSWNPVTEKLPDEKDYCLCCDKDGYITIGFISQWSKEWCFDDPEIDIDVVAWMPLPTPYEKQESDGRAIEIQNILTQLHKEYRDTENGAAGEYVRGWNAGIRRAIEIVERSDKE